MHLILFGRVIVAERRREARQLLVGLRCQPRFPVEHCRKNRCGQQALVLAIVDDVQHSHESLQRCDIMTIRFAAALLLGAFRISRCVRDLERMLPGCARPRVPSLPTPTEECRTRRRPGYKQTDTPGAISDVRAELEGGSNAPSLEVATPHRAERENRQSAPCALLHHGVSRNNLT